MYSSIDAGKGDNERETRYNHTCLTNVQVPLNFDDDFSSPSGSVPSTPVHVSSTHLPKKLHLYDSFEVAQELSMLDGELLRKIDPDELKNGAWMKKDKVGHLSTCLLHYIFVVEM